MEDVFLEFLHEGQLLQVGHPIEVHVPVQVIASEATSMRVRVRMGDGEAAIAIIQGEPGAPHRILGVRIEAGEDAGEAVENQGVQRRHQPGLRGEMVGLRADAGMDAGDLLGQG